MRAQTGAAVTDDQMEVDHVEAVDGEVDTMEVDNMVAAGENMYPSSALVPPLPSTPVATNKHLPSSPSFTEALLHKTFFLGLAI